MAADWMTSFASNILSHSGNMCCMGWSVSGTAGLSRSPCRLVSYPTFDGCSSFRHTYESFFAPQMSRFEPWGLHRDFQFCWSSTLAIGGDRARPTPGLRTSAPCAPRCWTSPRARRRALPRSPVAASSRFWVERGEPLPSVVGWGKVVGVQVDSISEDLVKSISASVRKDYQVEPRPRRGACFLTHDGYESHRSCCCAASPDTSFARHIAWHRMRWCPSWSTGPLPSPQEILDERLAHWEPLKAGTKQIRMYRR